LKADNDPANDDDMSKEEKNKLIELLSTEGKPGWFKKMTKTVRNINIQALTRLN